jgi:hypothetical protein
MVLDDSKTVQYGPEYPKTAGEEKSITINASVADQEMIPGDRKGLGFHIRALTTCVKAQGKNGVTIIHCCFDFFLL